MITRLLGHSARALSPGSSGPERRPPEEQTRVPAHEERGSILLEFALAIPILVALILGGISTGLAYNTNNSLNNGARAKAARFGATLPVDADLTAWLNQVADVAIGSTSGELAPTVPDQRICIAYVYPDGSEPTDRTISIVETGGSRAISPGTTCFDDGRPSAERRIQVVLERTAEIEAVIFNRDVSLAASSVVRFERST